MKRLITFLIALVSCTAFAQEGYQRGIKTYSGGSSYYYPGLGNLQTSTQTAACTANCFLDQAGEMVAQIGYLVLDGHPSGTKTCSSSGCKIYWKSGAHTAGTSFSLDIGLQDVSSTAGPPGQPDETFDVSATVTSGITQNATNTATMGTGSKALSDGQLIAVVFNLTAVNGAAIRPEQVTHSGFNHFPAGPFKTGGSWTIPAGHWPNVIIETDDGTLGWILGGVPSQTNALVTAFNTGSAADERMTACRFDTSVSAIGMYALMNAAASATFDMVLYNNACDGCTPVAKQTVSVDDQQVIQAGNTRQAYYGMPRTLITPGWWAVALKPTSANGVQDVEVTVSNANFLKAWGGTNCRLATRADAGALTHTTTTLPMMGFIIDAVRNK